MDAKGYTVDVKGYLVVKVHSNRGLLTLQLSTPVTIDGGIQVSRSLAPCI